MNLDLTKDKDNRHIWLDPYFAARCNPDDIAQWGILYCPVPQLPKDFSVQPNDTITFWSDLSKTDTVTRKALSVEFKDEIDRNNNEKHKSLYTKMSKEFEGKDSGFCVYYDNI
jgi:hypothetical protein